MDIFSLPFMRIFLFISSRMKNIEYVEYKGHQYPMCVIEIFAGTPDALETLVSSTDLEAQLLADMEDNDLSDAYAMDERFAYYLEPEEFELPYEEIVKLVEASYQ